MILDVLFKYAMVLVDFLLGFLPSMPTSEGQFNALFTAMAYTNKLVDLPIIIGVMLLLNTLMQAGLIFKFITKIYEWIAALIP